MAAACGVKIQLSRILHICIVDALVNVASGCRGAVDSIIWVFMQSHRSVFNLEFETQFESIRQVVADLWQRKDKISSCFKTAPLLFSSNVKIK